MVSVGRMEGASQESWLFQEKGAVSWRKILEKVKDDVLNSIAGQVTAGKEGKLKAWGMYFL